MPMCDLCCHALVLSFEECDCDGPCARHLQSAEEHWQCRARRCLGEFDICLPCAKVLQHPAATRSAAPLPPAAAPAAPAPARMPWRGMARGRAALAASLTAEQRMETFNEWRAKRAAAAQEAAAARSTAAAPLNGGATEDDDTEEDVLQGDSPFSRRVAADAAAATDAAAALSAPAAATADDEQTAPASAAPAGLAASTGSPSTTYALNTPLNVLQPEEPGERLQRQVQLALEAGGDEARRRLVALAFEIMRQLPTEFLADRLDQELGAMDSDDVVGVTGHAAEERPPSRTSPTPTSAPRTPHAQCRCP